MPSSQTAGVLVVKLLGDASNYQRMLATAQATTSAAAARITNAMAPMMGMLKKVGLIGGAAAVSGVGFGIKLAADAEQARMAFEVMLKSGEKADAMMKDLRKFANVTPFELPGITQAARSLLAFGIPAKDVMDKLGMIGDIASGAQIPIEELASMYGKMMTAGRIQAEEINMLQERGIPIQQMLADKYGVTTGAIRKMGEQGLLSGADVTYVFEKMHNSGGLFFKSMEKQSGTLWGLWSTMKDAVKDVFMGIGQSAVDSMRIKEMVKAVTDFAEKYKGQVVSSMKSMFDQVMTTAKQVAGFLATLDPAAILYWTKMAAGIGLAVFAFGKLMSVLSLTIGAVKMASTAFWGLQAAAIGVMGPIGGLAVVLGGLIAIPVAFTIGAWIKAYADLSIAISKSIALSNELNTLQNKAADEVLATAAGKEGQDKKDYLNAELAKARLEMSGMEQQKKDAEAQLASAAGTDAESESGWGMGVLGGWYTQLTGGLAPYQAVLDEKTKALEEQGKRVAELRKAVEAAGAPAAAAAVAEAAPLERLGPAGMSPLESELKRFKAASDEALRMQEEHMSNRERFDKQMKDIDRLQRTLGPSFDKTAERAKLAASKEYKEAEKALQRLQQQANIRVNFEFNTNEAARAGTEEFNRLMQLVPNAGEPAPAPMMSYSGVPLNSGPMETKAPTTEKLLERVAKGVEKIKMPEIEYAGLGG